MDINESMMSMFDKVYKTLSTWKMRNASFDNPVAALTFLCFLKFTSDNREILQLQYPEKYNLDYVELLYGEKISKGELIGHVSDIERQLGHSNGILENFSNGLDLLNMNLEMRELFEAINSLDFRVATDKDSSIYDALASYISLQGRNELRFSGELVTDIGLAKLMAIVASVEDDMSVYDFASGYGITLFEAARNKHNTMLYAQDINKIAAAISIMILTIGMKRNIIVNCGDTLTHPMTGQYDRKFDRVISVPPFGLRLSKEDATFRSGRLVDAFEYGLEYQLTGDLVFARHLLASLNDDGIGVLLMPMGALFREGIEGVVRKRILENNFIDSVIEMPSGIISNSMVKTAVVVFKKGRSSKAIYFLDLSSDSAKGYFEKAGRTGIRIMERGIEAVGQLVNMRQEIDGLSRVVSYDEIIEKNANLCPGVYLQVAMENIVEFENVEDLVFKNRALLDKLIQLDHRLGEIISRL